MVIDKSKRRLGGSYIKENGRLKKAPPTTSKDEKGVDKEPAAAKTAPVKKETKS